jgi:hypothetical protein
MAPFLMANTSRDERQWVFSFNFGLMTISSFFGNLLGELLPTWLGGLAGAAPTNWFVMPQLSGWLQVSLGALGFVPIFFTVAFFYVTAIGVEWAFFRRRKPAAVRVYPGEAVAGNMK